MRNYRIISDGSRYRAQFYATTEKWCDVENCYNEDREYVGRCYRWRWMATLAIWRMKRRDAYAEEHERKRRIRKNAIWERVE